jgi:phospholipid/cholesterol/gamma-HCH transport system substrate-binding protein
VLERFLVDSSRFVTALASRRDDLAALIGNLNSTTRALGDEKTALAEAIQRFPGFMKQANTTYVNLRSTLDELDPFVEASKPVAKRLRPYLAELRPFAREAVPTVRDMSALVRSRGRANDVTELNRTYPGLKDIALTKRPRRIDFGTGPVDIGERRGAFPELTQALTDSAPIIAHGRPYTVDLFGWFDDFSHTGAYDALGSFSRVQTYFNAFTVSEGLPDRLLPLPERGDAFKQIAKLRQVKRCPGASEEAAPDGSNVWSEQEQQELDCVEGHRATGAIK